eukprot:IDg2647t1
MRRRSHSGQALAKLWRVLSNSIVFKECVILQNVMSSTPPPRIHTAVLAAATCALREIVDSRQLAKPSTTIDFQYVTARLGEVAFCESVVFAETSSRLKEDIELLRRRRKEFRNTEPNSKRHRLMGSANEERKHFA